MAVRTGDHCRARRPTIAAASLLQHRCNDVVDSAGFTRFPTAPNGVSRSGKTSRKHKGNRARPRCRTLSRGLPLKGSRPLSSTRRPAVGGSFSFRCTRLRCAHPRASALPPQGSLGRALRFAPGSAFGARDETLGSTQKAHRFRWAFLFAAFGVVTVLQRWDIILMIRRSGSRSLLVRTLRTQHCRETAVDRSSGGTSARLRYICLESPASVLATTPCTAQ